MINCKGFTLVEVLLGAMIVGLIGMALAALTTAATRESGVGRARIMLRNQLSMAIRQLRQDVMMATSINLSDGCNMELLLGDVDQSVGPGVSGMITYRNDGAGTITRSKGAGPWGTTAGEAWLSNIVNNSGAFNSPECSLLALPGCNGGGCVNSILRVRLIVGTTGKPSVKESMEELIVLPQGFITKLKED